MGFFWSDYFHKVYTLFNTNNERSITTISKTEPLRRLRGIKRGRECKNEKQFFFGQIFLKLTDFFFILFALILLSPGKINPEPRRVTKAGMLYLLVIFMK